MRHNFLKIVTVMTAVIMCLSMVAMAAPAIDGDTTSASGTYTTTVNVTGVGASDEVSLLVVTAGTDLTKLVAGNVLYIDQATADSSGAAAFTFATSTEAFDVYSGYSTMALTDNPLDIKYTGTVVTGPTMDAEKSKLYDSTSPFGMTGYRRVFIKLTENNGQWVPAHSDEGSEIYYSTELTGYDGLVKTTATDLASIFGEITWTAGTPSTDATITKYGDVSGDENISAADYAAIRKNLLKTTTFSIKQNLAADTSDDASISAADYAAIRKYLLKTLTEFVTVTNRK